MYFPIKMIDILIINGYICGNQTIMETKKDRYVCWLPCKPYVKQFLLANYNAPDDKWTEIVDFSSDRELQADFVNRIGKKGRYEYRYPTLYRYTENVPVEIRKDVFYRYGWSISNTEAMRFGVKIERRIKQMLFLYLDTNISMGIPMSVAIRKFQAKFGFDDESWSYDTIRREYGRHRHRDTSENRTIFDFINSFFLEKMSSYGTITQQGRMTYENNTI